MRFLNLDHVLAVLTFNYWLKQALNLIKFGLSFAILAGTVPYLRVKLIGAKIFVGSYI